MYSWDLCCLLADGEGRITSFCLVQMKTCFPDGPEVDFSPGPPGNTTEKLMNVFVKPFLSLNHMSLTTKIKLLHRSWMGFEVHLGYRLLKGQKKKPSSHLWLCFLPSPPPFSTPLLSVLCWVCILRVRSTVLLSLGSVGMSLHLICIRFSTLSGSYLIPTQYAARGN